MSEKQDANRRPLEDSSSDDDSIDLEKQPFIQHGDQQQQQQQQQQPPPPKEYTVSTSRKMTVLAIWFLLNVALTIYNKAALGSFHFPWLLTVIHASCASIGSLGLLAAGRIKTTSLGLRENLLLAAFSALFTINIAISNVSLALVSVPLHQTVRSVCPVFAILIYRIFFSRTYSTETYLSLVPIVAGVALATNGDYECTMIGFLLTLLGVMLAAVKTIMSNQLMTGSLKLSPGEMLLRMSPLAAIQGLCYAAATGELQAAHAAWQRQETIPVVAGVMLLGNGTLAFLLNVSSFQTNKLAGALTLSVAGNLKQCLTILLGIVLFNVKVTVLNGAGMVLALIGVAWYSKVELTARSARK